MKISMIRDLLDADLLCCEENLDSDVYSACGSDMMSDVLAYVKDQAVLLTGLCNPQVIAHLIKSAKKAGVAYQNEVLVAGGTDAGAMQTSRGGIPVCTISIPCRYVHTPSEMVDFNDVKACADLVAAFAETKLEKEC